MKPEDNSSTEFTVRCGQMARGAKFRYTNGVGIYSSPALDQLEGFDHGFTARGGGVSKGYFSSLNLSFFATGNRENVWKTTAFSAARQTFRSKAWSWTIRARNDGLLVDVRTRAKDICSTPVPACDGLITNDPRITLITATRTAWRFSLRIPCGGASDLHMRLAWRARQSARASWR